MAVELPIPTILTLAKICEYLNVCKSAKNLALKGFDLDQNRGRLIYMERMGIQRLYDLNPNDATLRGTANYLYSILRYIGQAQQVINNQSAVSPVIIGPVDQSVTVGNTATFSVSVTGTGPFSYQWFLGGVLIPGATSGSYSKTNAQLTDSGTHYSVQVTGATGIPIMSNTATLTVTASLVALTWYGDTNPAGDLQSGIDNFSYQITTNITHNQPISIPIPQIATPDKYFVTKVPIGESLKTTWFNTPTNQGTLSGDFNYQNPIQFGGFTFYYSRQALSLDYTQPLIFS